MKRLLSIVFAFVLAASLLAGCSSKPEETENTTAQEITTAEGQTDTSAATDEEEAASEITTEAPAPIVQEPATGLAVSVAYEYQYKFGEGKYENYPQLIDVKSPLVYLSEQDAEKYPELAAALAEYRETNVKKAKEFYDDLELSLKDDESSAKDFITYKNVKLASASRADSKVLSIVNNGETYTGGAHGYAYITAENYDTATGKLLKLSDVITDFDQFKDVLITKTEGQLKEDLMMPVSDYLSGLNDINDLIWSLGYDGLTIYYNPYDITAYAYGIVRVTLDYETCAAFIDPYYATIPKKYAIPFQMYDTIDCDLDGDNEMDHVLVSAETEEYGYITKIIICVNDKKYTKETGGYSVNPSLVHLGDGKNYLYLEFLYDNDYRATSIYDLNGEKIKKLKDTDLGMHCTWNETDEYSQSYQLTDPTSFVMDVRTDALSTSTGCRKYHVGKKGLPVADEKWFTIAYPHTIKLKKAMKFDIVDEETGESIGKEEFPKKTAFTLTRTDNKTYVDAKLKDGRMVRIPVDMSKYPTKVNGQEATKVFKGMVFAG